MRRAVGRGIGLTVLLGAGGLRADPTPPAPPDDAHTARLSYTRGEGADRCPDEAALHRAVASRLGYDPFRPDAPRRVVATVRRAGPALGGDVEIGAASAVTGARHLTAAEDDCDGFVAAMALAISIAIDPQSLLRPPPPPRAATLRPVAVPVAGRARARAPAPPTGARAIPRRACASASGRAPPEHPHRCSRRGR